MPVPRPPQFTVGAVAALVGVFLTGCVPAGSGGTTPPSTPVSPAERCDDARVGVQKQVTPTTRAAVDANTIAVAASGTLVAAQCPDGLCRWNPQNGDKLPTFPSGGGRVTLSPDDSTIAVGAASGCVQLLDANTGTEQRSWQAVEKATRPQGPSGVVALAFSPDGMRLATASATGQVRVWNVADASLQGEFTASKRRLTAIAFSPDGRQLAVASTGQPVHVWDAAAGTLIRALTDAPEPGYSVAYSADGTVLAASSRDGVVLFDGRTHEYRSVAPDSLGAYGVAASADGQSVAFTLPKEQGVRLWRVGENSSRALSGHTDHPYAVAFGSDGTLYSAAGRDGVQVWDAAKGTARIRLTP